MSGPIGRREFLERSAWVGAAAGLAAGSTLRGADSPANRIAVGVMGLSRGRTLAVNLARQPGVDVKYVCDVDKGRAENGAKSVQSATGKTPQPIGDFRRILDDKQVDALVCAAPNHWHGPAAILGCSAGKHVYVEKPCCHNPREGELMVKAARKHQRAVQVGTQRRSSVATIEAIQKLRNGVIGRVYLARSWYANLRPSIGKGKPAEVPANLNYDLWQGPAPRVPRKNGVRS